MFCDINRLRREHKLFLNDHQTMVEGVLTMAGQVGVREVEQNNVRFKAPPSPGGIRRSTSFILHRTARGHIVKLRNTARHAAAQDSGSGIHGPRKAPYLIVARRARALRFIGRDGTIVFRRSVMHPGVKPTKFLWRATQSAYASAYEQLYRGMVRVAARH